MLMVNFVNTEITVVTATTGTLILVNQVKKNKHGNAGNQYSHKCAQFSCKIPVIFVGC